MALARGVSGDARPALVAWITNAASLPILAVGTLLLTQCVNGCVILRPDNSDPLLNNYSPIKTILPKAGKECQHWCANQL
jgi:hypothetical protein